MWLAEGRHQAVSLFYKEGNKSIISYPPPSRHNCIFNFTMGPNGQNQHFAELREKVCSSIHDVVLQRGLPSLHGKLEQFLTRK